MKIEFKKPVVILHKSVMKALAKYILKVPYAERIETQLYVYIESKPIRLRGR